MYPELLITHNLLNKKSISMLNESKTVISWTFL